MVTDSELSTRSGYTFYHEERLSQAAAHLKERAHISICGLPGTGKSTFVRQLISRETRKRFELDDGFLMVLLDGREFAHLPLEYIWGAICTALSCARSGSSVVCRKEGAQGVSYEDLKATLRSLKNYRVVVLLDDCSSLPHIQPEQSVCCGFLHLDKRYSPTLVTAPNPPSVAPACIPEVRDQFVLMHLEISPEQALRFADGGLSRSVLDRDLRDRISREIVDWVGGNLYLLDRACYWAAKESEILSTGHVYTDFSRTVYERCLKEAEQLFAAWWRILGEREQIILLAIDQLQRSAASWHSVTEALSGRGFVRRRSDRYLIHPKMFSDYVSRVAPSPLHPE